MVHLKQRPAKCFRVTADCTTRCTGGCEASRTASITAGSITNCKTDCHGLHSVDLQMVLVAEALVEEKFTDLRFLKTRALSEG